MRLNAEDAVAREGMPADVTLTPDQIQQVVHELRIHQIELEMQNDELLSARNDLESQRERYFDLYDLAPVGYLTLNGQGKIIEANLTATSMLGITRTDLLKKPFAKFIHPEDQDLYYLHCKKNKGTTRPQPLDMRLVHSDNTSFWAQLLTTFQANGEGRITFSDITPRKEAEAESAKLEIQLLQAKKMEAIGRLAGGIAHDFNNMLTVIIGHADLAKMSVDRSSPIYENLIAISDAAEHSSNLTRQLLAFARKQVISPKLMDLNEAVSSMLNILQRLIGEEINLNWHPSASLWLVMLDPSQFDQILANLCINARDSIAGIGNITIETENYVTDDNFCSQNVDCIPGEYVRFSVSDDGCGMDMETLAKIFEPFYTTKGFGKGTGLGLATVDGIVKQNHGFINVCSEPGVGTTFSIFLPRNTDATGHSEVEAPEETARHGKLETILVVEDDPAILNLISTFLKELNYRVLAANGPREAMRLAIEHSDAIQLLITDVVMPDMTGHDLANNLKKLNPQIKCLFMSGYTADIIATHGVLATGVHFIQKPFTPKLLSAKLREVLT